MGDEDKDEDEDEDDVPVSPVRPNICPSDCDNCDNCHCSSWTLAVESSEFRVQSSEFKVQLQQN